MDRFWKKYPLYSLLAVALGQEVRVNMWVYLKDVMMRTAFIIVYVN